MPAVAALLAGGSPCAFECLSPLHVAALAPQPSVAAPEDPENALHAGGRAIDRSIASEPGLQQDFASPTVLQPHPSSGSSVPGCAARPSQAWAPRHICRNISAASVNADAIHKGACCRNDHPACVATVESRSNEMPETTTSHRSLVSAPCSLLDQPGPAQDELPVSFSTDARGKSTARSAPGAPGSSAANHGAGAIGVLLAAGECVDARDRHGATALMYAAHQSNLPALQALLAGGADVDAAASRVPPLLSGFYLSKSKARSPRGAKRALSAASPTSPPPHDAASPAPLRADGDVAADPPSISPRCTWTRYDCADWQCFGSGSYGSNCLADSPGGAGPDPETPRPSHRCCLHSCAAIGAHHRRDHPTAGDVLRAAIVASHDAASRQRCAASTRSADQATRNGDGGCFEGPGATRQPLETLQPGQVDAPLAPSSCPQRPLRCRVPSNTHASTGVATSRDCQSSPVASRVASACGVQTSRDQQLQAASLQLWKEYQLAGLGQVAPSRATALYFAVMGGSLECAAALLRARCAVTPAAVHAAAAMLDYRQLVLLLSFGGSSAAVAVSDEGRAPLHTVLRNACGQCTTRAALRCVDALMRAGADPEATDRWGDPVSFDLARHLHSRPELMRAVLSSRRCRVGALNARHENLAQYVVRVMSLSQPSTSLAGSKAAARTTLHQVWVVRRLAYLGLPFRTPFPESRLHLTAAAQEGWKERRRFVLKALTRWNVAVTPEGLRIELPSAIISEIALLVVPFTP